MPNDLEARGAAPEARDVLVAPSCESPLRRPADPVLALLLVEQNLLERHAARSASSRYLPFPSNSPNAATSSRPKSTKYIRPPGPATGACSAASRSRGGRAAACSRSRRAAALVPSAKAAIRRAACRRRERRLPLRSRSPMPRRQACTASSSHSRTRSAIMRSAASAHATAASGGSVRMRSNTVRYREVRADAVAENDIGCRQAAQRGASHPGRSRSDSARIGRHVHSLRPVPVETEGPTRPRPTRVTATAPPSESRTTAMT